ncbi:MAG: hypothetical protein ACRD2L_07885, partial [Terriglobia bacterium]
VQSCIGGTIATSNEAAMVGGPIEATGLDEIVDFMVAIFIQQLCYQLHARADSLARWPSSGKESGGCRIAGSHHPGKICAHRVTFVRASRPLKELADFLSDRVKVVALSQPPASAGGQSFWLMPAVG